MPQCSQRQPARSLHARASSSQLGGYSCRYRTISPPTFPSANASLLAPASLPAPVPDSELEAARKPGPPLAPSVHARAASTAAKHWAPRCSPAHCCPARKDRRLVAVCLLPQKKPPCSWWDRPVWAAHCPPPPEVPCPSHASSPCR